MKKILVLLVLMGPVQSILAMEVVALIKQQAELNQKLRRKSYSRWSIDEIAALVKHGADLNTKDLWGKTPLNEAVRRGCLKTSQALIENGADVNTKNRHGWTPLHCAAKKGYVDVCKLLIEKGADMNLIFEDCFRKKYTPFGLAAGNGRLKVCKLLIEKGMDMSRWIVGAAKKNLSEICQALLEYSLIMPKTANQIEESRKKLFAGLWSLEKLNVVRGIRHLILNCNVLHDDYLPILLHLIKVGNSLPQIYRETVAAKLAANTIAQLKSLVTDALPYAQTDEIKDMLDPNLLEARFGDKIYENILERLEFLVRRAPDESNSFLSKSLTLVKSFFS